MVSSFGRPGQRVATDARALLRMALVAVVAAGAAFLPPPREGIAPHLADANEEPAVAPGHGSSGLFCTLQEGCQRRGNRTASSGGK